MAEHSSHSYTRAIDKTKQNSLTTAHLTLQSSKLGFYVQRSTARVILGGPSAFTTCWESNPHRGDSLWLDAKLANPLGHQGPSFDTPKVLEINRLLIFVVQHFLNAKSLIVIWLTAESLTLYLEFLSLDHIWVYTWPHDDSILVVRVIRIAVWFPDLY